MSIIKRIKNKLFSAGETKQVLFGNSTIQNRSLVSPLAYINSSRLAGDVKINDFVRLNEVYLMGNITIGKNTSIWGPNTDIHAICNEVRIGNFCSIARNVTIQEFNHDHKRCSSYFIFQNVFKEKGPLNDIVSEGPVLIGNDVWVGTQCVILSGVKIGNGAVVAANSVVNDDVPPYAIVGGTPARVLKYRFSDEIIEALQKLEWWNWDHEKIKRNRALFEGTMDLEKIKRIVE